MFENVPTRLEEALRRHCRQFDDQNFRETTAAGLVIVEYLKVIPTGPESNRFFEFLQREDGGVSFSHATRLKSIAETLFLFRSNKSFPEICRRFRTRDLRSTFFELFCYRLFSDAGFEILVHPESGVKGKDFDFVAFRDSTKFNVEVTSINTEFFSPNTIRNALDRKRTQLPTDAPSVIFIIIPSSWAAEEYIDFSLMFCCYQFLIGTKRANAVSLILDRQISLDHSGNQGLISFSCVTHVNTMPRHYAKLDFLFPRTPPLLRDIVSSGYMYDPAILDSAREMTRTSEFYRWIDYVLSNDDSVRGVE